MNRTRADKLLTYGLLSVILSLPISCIFQNDNKGSRMSNEAIAQYLATLTDRGISASTKRATHSDLFIFSRWWEARHARIFDVTAVVDRDIREWKQFRQQFDGAAPSTINRGLSTLRNFCTWAMTQGLLSENAAVGIEDVPTEPLSPRSLPDQAVDALLRAARNQRDIRLRLRDEAALALLVYAGLRVQEVCDVQLRDVDLAGGTIIVRSGKGGKARRIPLHPDAGRMLQRYLKEIRCPTA
jgi:site-specific recombinase XerD